MRERRDRIIMIKRQNPKRVTLPDGRTFYAKYKRMTRVELPANVVLRRGYKQRAAPRGKRRAVAGQQGGRGFKSIFKKALNFGKKAAKNKTVRSIARTLLNEAPGAVEALSKKVKNKKLRNILDSDIAKTGVDLATGHALDKLQ